MTTAIAAAALRTVGADRNVALLARGMSSSAWVGGSHDTRFVARVPNGDGVRPNPSYEAEAALLTDLAERGAPVATTSVVVVNGIQCSVAREVAGRPARPTDWSGTFVDQVAGALDILHTTDSSLAVQHDVVARFHLGAIWPLDDTALAEHPAMGRWPELLASLASQRQVVLDAATAAPTVVHTDLHWDHLLVRDDGTQPHLSGVLDFGDAFSGPAAWDHACLRYYHDDAAADAVLAATGASEQLRRDERLLGAAFGLYKVSKTPDRDDVAERAERLLLRAT